MTGFNENRLETFCLDWTSGKIVWKQHLEPGLRGLPNEMVASPITGAALVFVAGWTPGAGSPQMPSFEMLLERGDSDKDLRPDGKGDVTETHFLWEETRGLPSCPTPLWYEDKI